MREYVLEIDVELEDIVMF